MLGVRPSWFAQSFLIALLLVVLGVGLAQAAPVEVINLPAVQSAKGKVVLLDFWASWCTPCRKSFPWMNALQQKYSGRGLAVIAVNLDTDKQLAAEFLQATPAQFDIEYDSKGTQLNVAAMPTSFLLDRNGKIVKQHAGFREAQLAAREQEIEQLLKE
jgi:thiol-disulfide isomerase/thioredoxin